jgi:hypothetical protein
MGQLIMKELFDKIAGTLVMALAKMDQGEIEEAKQYIVGAIKTFDDECKILEEDEALVRQRNKSIKRNGKSKK